MFSIFPIDAHLNLNAFQNKSFFLPPQLAISLTDRYLMDGVLMDFPP